MQDLIEVFDLVTCECSLKSVYRVFLLHESKNEPQTGLFVKDKICKIYEDEK